MDLVWSWFKVCVRVNQCNGYAEWFCLCRLDNKFTGKKNSFYTYSHVHISARSHTRAIGGIDLVWMRLEKIQPADRGDETKFVGNWNLKIAKLFSQPNGTLIIRPPPPPPFRFPFHRKNRFWPITILNFMSIIVISHLYLPKNNMRRFPSRPGDYWVNKWAKCLLGFPLSKRHAVDQWIWSEA